MKNHLLVGFITVVTVLVNGGGAYPSFKAGVNQSTPQTQKQQPMLLAQTTDLAQQAQLVYAGINQFKVTYQRLETFKDKNQQINTIKSLIPIAEQNAQNLYVFARINHQYKSIVPSVPLANFFHQAGQHSWEMFETYVGWSEVLPKILSAIESNNQTVLNKLKQRDEKILNERMAMHVRKDQQLKQLWQVTKVANEAQMLQMITNLSNTQVQGIADRGRAAKCMVDTLPYGSAAQVASNPSAYCNAP